MDWWMDSMLEVVSGQAVLETLVDILLCTVPIWLAVMIGLFIGWSWRPRWTGLVFLGLRSKFRFIWTNPPGFGARRLWWAFTALSAFSVGHRLWFSSRERNRRKDSSAVSDEQALSEQVSVPASPLPSVAEATSDDIL